MDEPDFRHSNSQVSIHAPNGGKNYLSPCCQNILHIHSSCGRALSGLSSRLIDDRSQRITIIRKSETKPLKFELNDAQKKSLELIRSKVGKK